MNDHIWHSQHYFAEEGGIHAVDVMKVNRFLNDKPMGALAPGQHMDFPLDVMKRIIRPAGAT